MRRYLAALLLAVIAGACSESDPSSDATEDPTITPPPLPTFATTTTTALATIPPTTTTTTGLPTTAAAALVEDLEDGDHVGYVASIEGDSMAFDRVEPVDADGDGTPESVTNNNPMLRAVPLPASVPLDGTPVDPAAVATQLGGGGVLVRITVQNQQLVAIQRVTLAPPPPTG